MHAIAFLRGINLGGHNVKKGELIEVYESLGLEGVTTFIASGNVVFDKPSGSLAALETKAEHAFKAAVGYDASTFIRTTSQLHDVIKKRPFDGAGPETGGTLSVGFLKKPLPAANVKALKALDDDLNRFHADGTTWYRLTTTPRMTDAGLKDNLLSKALGHDTTVRSVKTILNILDKWPS